MESINHLLVDLKFSSSFQQNLLVYLIIKKSFQAVNISSILHCKDGNLFFHFCKKKNQCPDRYLFHFVET